MEDIVGLCKSLNISKDEEKELRLDDDLLAENIVDLQTNLVGKILINKPFNRGVFKKVLQYIWGMHKGINIKEIGLNIFVFSFNCGLEKNRVLEIETWNFNKAFSVLKDFDGRRESPRSREFRFTKFWMQMHNLPLHGMTEVVSHFLANQIGKCIEVEKDSKGKCWGVWVLIDISKPLRQGAKVRLGTGGPTSLGRV
ncbi:hypothetical protein PanWU01x14_013950 [Parasponia andersonii]|uniref:DUF4283 domain-containing protein n=1 Tax=Parasponia andersonii TaxID=3476 RepID=A0A2P5E156_PARAD|nr:hypothetical protein PanWU01x14_013950 [Parasponia andersonii]